MCEQGDDCYQPNDVFYEDYAGAFQGYATLEDVEQACKDSEIARGECEGWVSAQ